VPGFIDHSTDAWRHHLVPYNLLFLFLLLLIPQAVSRTFTLTLGSREPLMG